MPTRGRSDNEPALLRYSRTLREHVKLIIACAIVAVAVAAIYTRVASRRYSAEAQMLVSPADAGNAALAALPVLHSTSDPTRDTLTAAGLVTTPQVGEAVVKALHVDTSPTDLLGEVTATPIGQSNLIALQADAGTAAGARRLANAFADQVVATRAAALHSALATAIPGLQAQVAAETPAERASNNTLTSELSELEQLKSGSDPTITVAARASLPLAPYTPRTRLALVAALIAGLVVGIGGAFLMDALDPRLRREEQLRHLFNALILAGIPRERTRHRTGGPLLPSELSFAAHEGYRSLRTFLAAGAGNKPQAILLTGSAPAEGKTTTAMGLATALAQGGASVILIEADLRRPAIGTSLQLHVEYGTEHLVSGEAELEQALTPIVLDGAEVHVVAVRHPSDHIAERLSFDFSQRLVERAKELADFVVIDSPPITAVVDALPLAKFVDNVLIVSRLGVSKLAKIAELYEMLLKYGSPPLGFVVIGQPPIRGSLYYSSVEGRRPGDIRQAPPRQSAPGDRSARFTVQARGRAPYAGWGVVLLAMSAAVGLAAGGKPSIGVAAAIGITFSLVTLSDVTAGLVLFTILSFLDVLNSSTGGSASFIKVAGLLLFGSWFAQRLVGAASTRAAVARIPSTLLFSVVALAVWSAISVTWAESSGTALTSTMSFVLNMLLFPIVMVAVRRGEHLNMVLAAFLIGAIISTAYGFISPAATGSVEGRLAGGIGDANEQAAVLVASIPMAIGLGAAVRRPALRYLSWAGGLICLVGVFSTLSRGGLIALGLIMVVAVVFGGRWRTKAAVLLAVTVLGTVTYYFAIAPLAARQRVTMSSTSGRSDIWRVGWRMVQAHPVIGVGSGNFQIAAIHYVQGIGTLTSAFLIVDVPHVAHNVYLELLADLGIPGLLAFVGVAGCSLLAAARAARGFERLGEVEMELLARCLVLALVAFLSADFFLSGEFSKQLWLTFALCPATLALSRSARVPAPQRAAAPDTAYAPQPAF